MVNIGSHGCWGLDDYYFFPYLFGSCQLEFYKILPPDFVLDRKLIDDHLQFLYAGAIDFLLITKKGLFFEHSNLLYNITAVDCWARISRGIQNERCQNE